MNDTAILFTKDELIKLTGYERPTLQLEVLRRDGFWRARMGRRGVILERSHYDAVTRGEAAAPTPAKKTPNFSHLKLA
jgi:hypothetical protein